MAAGSRLSREAGSALAAATYLGNLPGALVTIAVSVPPAPAIRGGLVAIGLTTLAMPIGDRVGAWLVLRAATGFASAWVLVFVSAWCEERLAVSPPRLLSPTGRRAGSGSRRCDS